MKQLLTTNFQPSPIDSRDRVANLPIVSQPKSVDLKPWAEEVENQFQFGSCTANAGCSALELMYKLKEKPVDLSRMYLYYWTRKMGGIEGDRGAYPRDIGKALKAYGVPPEKDWEYQPDHLDTEPPADVVAKAMPYRITSYEQLIGVGPMKLMQIKNALAQNIPVLINFEVHAGVFNLSGSWKTHSWNWETSANNPSQGWHEVLCIGYDDDAQRLLCENSWGTGYGDGGFFGIPYDMVKSNAFGEMWVVEPNYDVAWDGTDPYKEIQDEIKNQENKAKMRKYGIIGAFVLAFVYSIGICYKYRDNLKGNFLCQNKQIYRLVPLMQQHYHHLQLMVP